jgi:opacity protein-like surface antigen
VKGGFIFSNEPKYAIKDNFAVGLKLEGALTAAVLNQGQTNEEVKVQLRSVYQATGDYYFTNNSFRPFAGAGVGLMRVNSATASTNTTTTIDESAIEAGTRFAFSPRIGFEVGHFRLAAEYNYGSKNSSYFGIKIGAFAGGGKK